MVVTARRIELVRAVRVNHDDLQIEPEYNPEPPQECLECESFGETYNEVTPEAVEYMGLQCLRGGCDRG